MEHNQIPSNVRRMAEGEVARNQHPPPQPCPRCNSTNTKFCYYNNYSLSQPRYFCKGCRRYWTHGGTLRNVPVGGGCRKSKRPKLATPAAADTPPPLPPPPTTTTSATAPLFYGGGGGGFLSSLAAIQAGVGAQTVGFGPNMGLFGMGFPGLEAHQQITPQHDHNNNNNDDNQQQQLSFQQLLQRRPNENNNSRSSHHVFQQGIDVGGGLSTSNTEAVPSSVAVNWNLSNTTDDEQSNWSHFPGSTGVDDP